jgi:hypothetical protein
MPSIFSGLEGAGAGALGAQQYIQGKQALESNALSLERAKRQMAEEESGRARDEAYRKGMSEAIASLGQMRSVSQPATPTLTARDVGGAAQKGFASGGVMGAAAGAAGEVGQFYDQMEQVKGWLQGKDDKTAQAVQNLQNIASRVAAQDPQAAMWVLNQGREQIRGRVIQAAVGQFTERGSKLIRHINELSSSGRLSEEAAIGIQDRLQQAMELAESDPQQLGTAENAYNTAFNAIRDELKEQARKKLAIAKLDWHAADPMGMDAAVLEEARDLLDLGIDPDQVLGYVRGTQTAWTGGMLKDAPPARVQEWKADAWDATIKFLGETVKQGPTEKAQDYVTRLMDLANQYLPMFEVQVQRRNGVIDAGQAQPGTTRTGFGGEQGPTASDARFLLGRMAPPPAGGRLAAPGDAQSIMGGLRGGQPQAVPQQPIPQQQASPAPAPAAEQVFEPIDPSALNRALSQERPAEEPKQAEKARKLKRIKIKKDEDPASFAQRVVNEVRKVGGGRDDVLDVLEANGISPDSLQAKQPKQEAAPFIGKM